MRLADLPRNRLGIPVFNSPDYGRRRPADRWARCPVHGAQIYADRDAAEDAKQAEAAKRVYRCRVADGWHIAGGLHSRPR